MAFRVNLVVSLTLAIALFALSPNGASSPAALQVRSVSASHVRPLVDVPRAYKVNGFLADADALLYDSNGGNPRLLPVVGATVSFGDSTAVTDGNGRFTLTAPAGRVALRFSKRGYVSESIEVDWSRSNPLMLFRLVQDVLYATFYMVPDRLAVHFSDNMGIFSNPGEDPSPGAAWLLSAGEEIRRRHMELFGLPPDTLQHKFVNPTSRLTRVVGFAGDDAVGLDSAFVQHSRSPYAEVFDIYAHEMGHIFANRQIVARGFQQSAALGAMTTLAQFLADSNSSVPEIRQVGAAGIAECRRLLKQYKDLGAPYSRMNWAGWEHETSTVSGITFDMDRLVVGMLLEAIDRVGKDVIKRFWNVAPITFGQLTPTFHERPFAEFGMLLNQTSGYAITDLLRSWNVPLVRSWTLFPGESTRSGNGRFSLTYAKNGNLVLYDDRSRDDQNQTVLWETNIGEGNAGQAIMQADGNLVVYDAGGVALWSSGTPDNPNAYLVVQDDGNVVIYRSNREPIWATGTNR